MSTTRSSHEIAAAARNGAVSFVGSMVSAVMGFAFTVVLAQTFGVVGSGLAFQAVGIFSIALAISRLGSDTTAMWLIPRLRHQDPMQVPAGITTVLVQGVVVSSFTAGGWLVLLWLRNDHVFGAEIDRALALSCLALPFGCVMVTSLAATRAFGSVLPFSAIQNVAVPLMRVVAVPVIAALGGGAVAAAVVWAWLFFPGAVLALIVLAALVRRQRPGLALRPVRPDRDIVNRSVRFGIPRAVSAAAEQANLWLGVILVGALAGDASAGAYGAAARFVGAGYVVGTAVRIAVAPRFSALFAQGRVADVDELYAASSRWILLFGSPIYFVLAVNAGTILNRLGDGFDQAARAMVILCAGSIVFLASGNVQSLLLMSGGSGVAAINKIVAVAVLAGGTLLLQPMWGLEGAAIAWTVSTVLDTALSVLQVRRTTGIALSLRGVAILVLVVGFAVLVPCVLSVLWLGAGIPALVAGTAGSAVSMAIVSWAGRTQLRTDELVGALRRR